MGQVHYVLLCHIMSSVSKPLHILTECRSFHLKCRENAWKAWNGTLQQPCLPHHSVSETFELLGTGRKLLLPKWDAVNLLSPACSQNRWTSSKTKVVNIQNKCSATSDRALQRIANANRSKSTAEMSSTWNEITATPVSRSTTGPVVCENKVFRLAFPALNPRSPAKQKEKPLQFARKYSKWTAENWKKVLFSNDSKFTIGHGNKGPWVWQKTMKDTGHNVWSECKASGVDCGLGLCICRSSR